MHTGHTYVVPLNEIGETLYSAETIAECQMEGDLTCESRLSVFYPYRPQIERTAQGYLATADWTTLAAEGDAPVLVDVDWDEEMAAYKDLLRFVPESAFAQRMEALWENSQAGRD